MTFQFLLLSACQNDGPLSPARTSHSKLVPKWALQARFIFSKLVLFLIVRESEDQS